MTTMNATRLQHISEFFRLYSLTDKTVNPHLAPEDERRLLAQACEEAQQAFQALHALGNIGLISLETHGDVELARKISQATCDALMVSRGGANPLDAGRATAAALLPLLRSHEEAIATDKQRLLWWTGFLAYIGGAVAASIGPGALDAIQAMTGDALAKTLKSHTH